MGETTYQLVQDFFRQQYGGSYYIDKVDGTTPKCGDLEGAMTKKIHGSG